MKKYIMVAMPLLLMLLGAHFAAQEAAALDAPHSSDTNRAAEPMACTRCHFSPSSIPTWWTDPRSSENTMVNNLCKDCHSQGKMSMQSPYLEKYTKIETHSAFQTGSAKWGGNWTVECKVCHNQHNQLQITSYATDSLATIETGTVTSITSIGTVTSAMYDSQANFSPDALADYILIPNTASSSNMFRIKSNTNNTITVYGRMSNGVGKTYVIRYGKLLKNKISYRLPSSSSINATVKFYRNSGEYSFTSGTNPSTSICMVCHTQTHSYTKTGSLADPDKHTSGDSDQQPGGKCSKCHFHSNGFKPPDANCDDCHGNPPKSNTTGTDGMVGFNPGKNEDWGPTGATNPLSVGAHTVHSATYGLFMTCEVCHKGSESVMPTPDGAIRMGFDARTANYAGWTGGTAVDKGTIEVFNSLASPSYSWIVTNTGTTLVSSSSQSYYCSNLYCHGGGVSGVVSPLSGGSNTKPSWIGGSSQVQCSTGSCHGTTNTTYVSAGSHSVHAGSTGFGGKNYPCNYCHGTISAGGAHVNGSVNWDLSAVPSGGGQYRGAQSGGTGDLAPSASYGTCNLVSCHSSGQDPNTGLPGGLTYGSPVWGGSLACDSCHKNMKTDSPSSGSHYKHAYASQANYDCGQCHAGYTESSTAATHGNNLINLDFTAGLSPSANYSQPTNTLGNGYGNCTVAYCHSQVQTATGASVTSYATVAWGPGGLGCGSCHKDMSADGTAPSKHAKHAQSALIPCATCHNGYTASSWLTGTHVNATVDVKFDPTGPGNGGFYSGGTVSGQHQAGGGYGTCYAVYCHSDVQGASGTGGPTYVNQALNASLNCGSCHKNMVSDSAAPGSHKKHAQSYSIGCDVCHNGYTSTSWIAATHSDKIVDVDFTGAAAGGSYSQPTNTPGNGYGSCDSVYCHSDVQGVSGSGSPATYKTVTWGDASLNCGSCHKDMNTDASAPGSHPLHTISNGYACSVCHGSGYTANSVSNLVTHVNSSIETSFTGTAAGASYSQNPNTPGDGYGTCSATTCHGSGTPTWGVNTTNDKCTKCHGTLTAGTVDGTNRYLVAPPNDTSGLAGSLTGSGQVSDDPQVGAHQTHLQMFNGLMSTSTTSYDVRCQWCHVIPTGAGHADGSAQPSFTGLATLSGAMSPTYNPATGVCTNVYCHDPAGTGGTLDLANTGSKITPTWTDTNYYTDAGRSQANCGVCHKVPGDAGFTATASHATYTLSDYADCSGCHGHNGDMAGNAGERHLDGVKYGGGCNNCHGNPPLENTVGGDPLMGVVGSPNETDATNPASAGAHRMHVVTKNMNCNTCHKGNKMPAYGDGIQMGFNIDSTNFPGFGSAPITAGTFSGYDTLANGYTWSASWPGTTVLTVGNRENTCAVYCHGTKNAVSWQAAGPLACNACHENTNNGGAGLSARHQQHYNTTYSALSITTTNQHSDAGYVYGCANCHPSTEHVNGPVNSKQTASVLGAKVTAYTAEASSTTDSQGFVYSQGGGGGCTTYCHSNGLGSNKTPTWSATATGACNICHSAPGDSTRDWSGPHEKHLVSYSTNTNFTCNACHDATAKDNNTIDTAARRSNHTDNVKTLSFNSWVNSAATGTAGVGCDNTYCHSDGTSLASTHSTTAWSGARTCSSCHGNSSGNIITTGTHSIHVGTDTPMGIVNCGYCHKATASNDSTLQASGGVVNHVNKQVTILFDSSVALSAATYSGALSGGTNTFQKTVGDPKGSCDSTYCHGGKSRIWNQPTGDATCVKCHGVAGTSPSTYATDSRRAAPGYIVSGGTATGYNTSGGFGALTGFNSVSDDTKVGAHNAHVNSNGGYSAPIACSVCHQDVTSVATTSHMSGDTTFAWSNPSNTNGLSPSYTPATKTCSNVWCHGAGMPLANQGTGTAPVWTSANTITSPASTLASCDSCHKSPPIYTQGGTTLHSSAPLSGGGCTTCHSHIGSGPEHIDGKVDATGGDACTSCHNSSSITAMHAKHTDHDHFLTGKSLAGGAYGDPLWWYEVYDDGTGKPKFACGYCHPDDEAAYGNHTGGSLGNPPSTPPSNVALEFSAATGTGTLKEKNSASPTIVQNSGNVTCTGVYCHSNGYDGGSGYTYKTTPDWYSTDPWGAVDRCAQCHDNSPTGSAPHGAHVVGIHYDNVFSGTTGLTPSTGAGGSGAGHGDPATSTTINCNICHAGTVSTSVNANNTVCMACHTDTDGAQPGNDDMVTSLTTTLHVNGQSDVVFAGVQVRTRAQLRPASLPGAAWTRVNGYKSDATVYDKGTTTLSSSETYSMTTKNCTVACHNNVQLAWNATGVNCNTCHTGL